MQKSVIPDVFTQATSQLNFQNISQSKIVFIVSLCSTFSVARSGIIVERIVASSLSNTIKVCQKRSGISFKEMLNETEPSENCSEKENQFLYSINEPPSEVFTIFCKV